MWIQPRHQRIQAEDAKLIKAPLFIKRAPLPEEQDCSEVVVLCLLFNSPHLYVARPVLTRLTTRWLLRDGLACDCPSAECPPMLRSVSIQILGREFCSVPPHPPPPKPRHAPSGPFHGRGAVSHKHIHIFTKIPVIPP